MNPENKIELKGVVVNIDTVVAREKAKREVLKLVSVVAGRKNSHYPEGEKPHY